jgi:hypothetical protein
VPGTIAADDRADVLGPAPARLGDQLPHREIAELDDAASDAREVDDVVGLLEALRDDVSHR